jgi:hypothetical protein
VWRLYHATKQRIRKKPQEERSNDEKKAMQYLRYSLDITLASQAEDPPEYVRRAFSCWPPRKGNVEDAFAAQDHEVVDDGDEKLGDDEGVAAAEHEMESETVGHLDQELEKEPEEKQDEGALNSIAIRPKENQDTEGKPEGKGGAAEEAKSPAKSLAKPSAKWLVFAKNRSMKVIKQRPRRRF